MVAASVALGVVGRQHGDDLVLALASGTAGFRTRSTWNGSCVGLSGGSVRSDEDIG